MSHKQIYNYFAECLPDYADRVKLYLKNGNNGIRLRMLNGEEYTFTINNGTNWKFERMR